MRLSGDTVKTVIIRAILRLKSRALSSAVLEMIIPLPSFDGRRGGLLDEPTLMSYFKRCTFLLLFEVSTQCCCYRNLVSVFWITCFVS